MCRLDPSSLHETTSAAFWNELLARERPSLLVLWRSELDRQTLDGLGDVGGKLDAVFVSSSLMGSPPEGTEADVVAVSNWIVP